MVLISALERSLLVARRAQGLSNPQIAQALY
jgi:hypothetical protein